MNSTIRCPDCGNQEARYDETPGEIVCAMCGLVIEEAGFEKKPFISESRKNLATDSYLSEAGGKDQDGKIVKASWLRTTREKNYNQARKKLQLVGSRLRLPDYVIKEANVIFKRSMEQNLNVGRDNNSLVYASIYAACMTHRLPKIPLELSIHGEITIKKLMRTYRMIKDKLGLKIAFIDPVDLIPRFASQLKMTPEATSKAVDIVNQMKECQAFLGKNPQTLVATALYLAGLETGCEKTQRDVTNVTGVIEVTIRKRIKEMTYAHENFMKSGVNPKVNGQAT